MDIFDQLKCSDRFRKKIMKRFSKRKPSKLVEAFLGRFFMNDALRQHVPIFTSVKEGSAPFNSMDASEAAGTGQFDEAVWTFFSNPMRWPAYGPGYRVDRADGDLDAEGFIFAKTWEPPKDRAEVAPFTVFTLEVDSDGDDALQSQLDLLWTAGAAKVAPVIAFDEHLRSAFRDYRGFCAVWSGNKSIHFHFVFETGWLDKNVLIQWAELRGVDRKSALRNHVDGMLKGNVFYEYYRVKWRMLAHLFNEITGLNLDFDTALSQFSQKRRLPWGTRVIGQDGPERSLHGFSAGTPVPQVVLEERIFETTPKGSTGYFFRAAEGNQVVEPMERRVKKREFRPRTEEAANALLEALRDYLAEGWHSEYPRPASITQDGGVYFSNHPDDRHPSTYVGPGHWRLAHRGRHPISVTEFPERLDITSILEILVETLRDKDANAFEASGFDPVVKPQEQRFGMADRIFQRLLSGERPGLEWRAMSDATGRVLRTFPHVCITSVEGIGKSRGVLDEANRYRTEDGLENFFAEFDLTPPGSGLQVFASPSYLQAAEQMVSYLKGAGVGEHREGIIRPEPRRAVLLKSFSQWYKEVTSELSQENLDSQQITYADALGRGYTSLVHAVHDLQPEIYREVTRRKNAAWEIEPIIIEWPYATKVDCGFRARFSTMVFTVHDVAQGLHRPSISNAWLHPDFDFDEHGGSPDAYRDLVKDVRAYRIIHDEVAIGDLAWVATPEEVEFAEIVRVAAAKHWSELSYPERYEVYQRVSNPAEVSFFRLLNLIEANFSDSDAEAVNYEEIPFGNDNREGGPYRGLHGKKKFVKQRSWFRDCRARVVFLTTEGVPSSIIRKLKWTQKNKKSRNCDEQEDDEQAEPKEVGFRVYRWDRDDFFKPDQIELILDNRASARKIEELVAEVVDPDTGIEMVITNGSRHPQAISHVSSQGRNDLTATNIVTVITYLAPDHFALLNVLQQKFDIPDVIRQHYRDMINQAMGRNRGFRRRGVDVTLQGLIVSPRLYRELGSAFFRTGRYRFHLSK